MSKITFPKMEGKQGFDPYFTPGDFIENIQRKRYCTKKVVFTYSSHKLNSMLIKSLGLRKIDNFIYGSREHHISMKNDVSLLFLSIGAPITAIATDVMAAVGATEFLILGASGGINKELSVGDIVLCSRAVRDEGTSHHYIKNSFYSNPDIKMTTKLANNMKKNNIRFFKGADWTVDAMFRETKKELEYYREKGILTVEMEASALFAVAKAKRLKASAAFVISDLLVEQSGTETYDELKLAKGYENLARVAKLFISL